METILRLAGLSGCVLVLAGCICRIGLMKSKRNRFIWWLVYALMAVYAGGVLLDLVMDRRVDWYARRHRRDRPAPGSDAAPVAQRGAA